MSERILVAVDESPASEKAVEYVAGWAAGRSECHVHLVHVLPPAPESALAAVERGGDAYDRWLSEQQQAGRGALERMRERLARAGVADDRVDVGVLVAPGASIAEGLMDIARDQTCVTIVVGRNSLPWYRELVHHHPADELVRKAKGFTLWIVE